MDLEDDAPSEDAGTTFSTTRMTAVLLDVFEEGEGEPAGEFVDTPDPDDPGRTRFGGLDVPLAVEQEGA